MRQSNISEKNASFYNKTKVGVIHRPINCEKSDFVSQRKINGFKQRSDIRAKISAHNMMRVSDRIDFSWGKLLLWGRLHAGSLFIFYFLCHALSFFTVNLLSCILEK